MEHLKSEAYNEYWENIENLQDLGYNDLADDILNGEIRNTNKAIRLMKDGLYGEMSTHSIAIIQSIVNKAIENRNKF